MAIGPRDERFTEPLLQPLICCVPRYGPEDGVEGCLDGTQDECCAATGTGEVCCGDEQTEAGGGVIPWSGAVPAIWGGGIFGSFSTFLFSLATHTMIPQVVVELVPSSRPQSPDWNPEVTEKFRHVLGLFCPAQ
jgi:hypothetical protein